MTTIVWIASETDRPHDYRDIGIMLEDGTTCYGWYAPDTAGFRIYEPKTIGRAHGYKPAGSRRVIKWRELAWTDLLAHPLLDASDMVAEREQQKTPDTYQSINVLPGTERNVALWVDGNRRFGWFGVNGIYLYPKGGYSIWTAKLVDDETVSGWRELTEGEEKLFAERGL